MLGRSLPFVIRETISLTFFAFLYTKDLMNRVFLLMERSKFFPFRTNPLFRRREKQF